MTLAPALAKARADARPMPELPPVTSATFPAKPPGMDDLSPLSIWVPTSPRRESNFVAFYHSLSHVLQGHNPDGHTTAFASWYRHRLGKPAYVVARERYNRCRHVSKSTVCTMGATVMTTTPHTRYRSRDWFDTPELYGWLRRAAFKAEGFGEPAYEGRPIIGICNSWSELTHCNAHLRQVAEAVKRGVWQAGGFPLEFPVMSLGEYNMRPTTMLYRNLMSMDVEESITANPLDGVVLLGGCDKTTPALLMGAASADIPAILVTGGPQLKGNWRGEELGSCTDCRRYQQELRAERITEEDWAELQNCIVRSPGHCMVMGTASTMAAMGEALGMTLPGNAAIPAVDSRRQQLAEASGRQIVQLVEQGLRPSTILTLDAFENAIRTLHAIGG